MNPPDWQEQFTGSEVLIGRRPIVFRTAEPETPQNIRKQKETPPFSVSIGKERGLDLSFYRLTLRLAVESPILATMAAASARVIESPGWKVPFASLPVRTPAR